MLEECRLEYRINLIDIGKGDQFTPDFLNIKRRFDTVKARPAVVRAEGIGRFLMDKSYPVTERNRQLIVNLPVE